MNGWNKEDFLLISVIIAGFLVIGVALHGRKFELEFSTSDIKPNYAFEHIKTCKEVGNREKYCQIWVEEEEFCYYSEGKKILSIDCNVFGALKSKSDDNTARATN